MSTVPNTRLTQQTADKLLALISECRQTAREAAQVAVRHIGSAMPQYDVDGAEAGWPAMTTKSCTGLSAARTCLQRLADGWITHQDLCPPCTRTFMAGLEHASPEPLKWHPGFLERAGMGGEVQ